MEMEMEFLRKLPTPQELKEQFPVSTEVVERLRALRYWREC